MTGFPYEEIRNAENGDRFDTPQEALKYMINRHIEQGGVPDDQPTMENVWMACHGDGEISLRKNEDGTFTGEETHSEIYSAPVLSGPTVNFAGYFGTDARRSTPDETYHEKFEIEQNQVQLLQYYHSVAAIEVVYNSQKSTRSTGSAV